MNPASFVEAENILRTVKRGVKKSDNTKIIICPPSVYLSKIKASPIFDLGIQNVFWEDVGAYTGEISARMAKNLGAGYVIVGHSERRIYLKETDEMVNLKVRSVLRNNLKPILCVGETLEERQQNKTNDVIVSQLEKALNDVSKFQIPNLSSRGIGDSKFQIAYEPVWAIGAGETPTFDEIMSAGLLIKKILTKLYDRKIAEEIPILYGGSVNSKNGLDFVEKANTDGLLVGGASLNASEFVRIVNLFGE